MIKRKNDDLLPAWSIAEWLYVGFLVAGMLLLSVISVGATWSWLVRGNWWNGRGQYSPAPASTRRAIVEAPLQVVARDPVALSTLATSPYAWAGTHGDGHLSAADGHQIFRLLAQAVALSPDGHTLAVRNGGGLSIRQRDGSITALNLVAVRFMAWNVSDTQLAIATTDALYRYELASARLDVLIDGIQLVAPPISNPATGRILIAELDGSQTMLRSMDANCATPSCARNSLRMVARVPFQVTWADYHPGATAILLCAADGPDLYLLHTGDGRIDTLSTAANYPRQPLFSPDGRSFAYVDQQHRVIVAQVETPALTGVALTDVQAFAWARP
jgi:hypothetical protein